MKNLLMLTASLLVSLYSFSQDNIKNGTQTESHIVNQEKYDFDQLRSKLDGTFQFKIIDSNIKPLLNLELLQLIESSRLDNETTVLDLGESIWLVIPSEDEINSSSFTSLKYSNYITTK